MGSPTPEYVAIDSCPLWEECNENNYNTWKVWGDTTAQSQDQLWKHLNERGSHTMHRKEMEASEKRELFTDLCMSAPTTLYTWNAAAKDWVMEKQEDEVKDEHHKGKGLQHTGRGGGRRDSGSQGSQGSRVRPTFPPAPPANPAAALALKAATAKRRKVLKGMR